MRWKSSSALITLLVIVADVVCSAIITVDPLKIVVELVPGEVKEGVVTVTNLGEETTRVSVEPVDFFFDERGSVVTLEPGTLGEASLFRYLVVSASLLSLGPGESGRVSYRIQLPSDATGSHWVGIAISEEEPEVVEEKQGDFVLRTEMRIVYLVGIYQNPLSRPPEPWIRVLEVEGTFSAAAGQPEGAKETHTLAISALVENLTDTILVPQGRVEIRNSSGDTVVREEIEEFNLLPHARLNLQVRFAIEEWKAGDYLCVVVIDAGGETLAAGQGFVEVPPR